LVFGHIGILHFVLFSLSLIILLVPIGQANANSIPPAELTEKELIELYKQEQLLRAEKLRDYILDFQHSTPNPYHDSEKPIPEFKIASFVDPNKDPQYYVDRYNNEEAYMNWFDKYYPEYSSIYEAVGLEEPIPEFKIDDQTGHMKRTNEDFQIYKLKQLELSEKLSEEIFEKNRLFVNDQTNNNKNQEMKFIKVSPEGEIILKKFNDDMITHNLIQREDTEFKNLIVGQTVLSEITRDQVIGTGSSGLNPYLNEDMHENVDENVEESSIKTNTGIVIAWSDPTYVTDKSELNIIDRDANDFEMFKAMEIEIAQNTLNEILMLSNSEKIGDEISEFKIASFVDPNKDPQYYVDRYNNEEAYMNWFDKYYPEYSSIYEAVGLEEPISDYNKITIMNGEEIKIPKYYDRNDDNFEFFKNVEIDKAKAKLIELYG